jgi:hypothetical protein
MIIVRFSFFVHPSIEIEKTVFGFAEILVHVPREKFLSILVSSLFCEGIYSCVFFCVYLIDGIDI